MRKRRRRGSGKKRSAQKNLSSRSIETKNVRPRTSFAADGGPWFDELVVEIAQNMGATLKSGHDQSEQGVENTQKLAN